MPEEKTPTTDHVSVPEDTRIHEFETDDGWQVKAYSFPDGSAYAQQMGPEESDADAMLGKTLAKEVLRTDYPSTKWAETPEMNTRVRTACRVVARNVGGLRWHLVQKKKEREPTPERLELINRQTELVQAIFDTPNPFIPLTEVFYRTWYDRKATGKGHVEVTRNAVGKIDGIYHLQSKNVHALKKGGWVQKRGRKKKYFKEFGDKRIINANTGKVHNPEEDGGALALHDRATEVITFVEYSSDVEPVLGAPPHASASTAISGNWYSAKRNRNMQVTDGTPRAIITVQGGALTERSEESIHRFLNAIARDDEDTRSNRIMVLSVQKPQPSSGTNPSIHVTPLTIGSNEDATFLKYRKANDEEIRECFSLAALYFGSTEGTNRASASVARHITIEQAFKPESEELEYRINASLVKDILMGNGYNEDEISIVYRLIRPPATDEVEQSQVMSRYIQGGGLAPNDIRRHLNSQGFDLEEWDGAWAELPLFVTLAALKLVDNPADVGINDIDVDGSDRGGAQEVLESFRRFAPVIVESIKKDLE